MKRFFILSIFTIFAIFSLLVYKTEVKIPAIYDSFILTDKNGQIISQKLSSGGFCSECWIEKTDDFPEILKQSVVHFEDRFFYYHFGVNPLSIARAFFHNLKSENKIGASTISMQVARLIEPKERTYANKFREILVAIKLEILYSKDEILSLYLNLAPYGGNIVGVGAASRFYFGKELENLSVSEVALLSTIPKNPNKNRLDKNPNLNALKNRALSSLLKAKIIDESTYKRALSESFEPERKKAINHAFHYSNLAHKNGLKASNLDLNLQLFIEKRAKILLNSLKSVQNASIVVIDNEKMEVIAYIGSHDLKAKDGYNDGAKMIRNVGSTLKPFIYALSLDNGLITPKMNLVDTTISKGFYSPKNFNSGFLGTINASSSLELSLNTPAVFLNSNLKENSLFELLKSAGLTKEEKSFYGEAIALGSISLSLLDLTHLYSAFANSGELKSLKVAGSVIDKNVTLFSPQSAFLVAEILKDSPREYLNSVWQNSEFKTLFAFKTGTSANSTDLLAIGFNKDFTAGVWMGNFDGSSSGELTGGGSSARLLVEIFNFLGGEFLKEPSGISKSHICTDEFEYEKCKNYAIDKTIDGVSLKSRCEMISPEQLNYLVLNKFINENELQNGRCKELLSLKAPLLASPNLKEFYSSNSKIPILCYSFFSDEIYIKLDENDYFKARSGESFFMDISRGFHTIKCLDENSNLSEFSFEML